jgi:hypothetical protein
MVPLQWSSLDVWLQEVPHSMLPLFSVLATLRSMSEPMRWIPEALSVLIQVNVSLVRLNSFLLDDQLNKVEM